MSIILGLDGALDDLLRLKAGLAPELFAAEFAAKMEQVVHVQTGYLKSTVGYDRGSAYAKAEYAGYEMARGGGHDFVEQAYQVFAAEVVAKEAVDGV